MKNKLKVLLTTTLVSTMLVSSVFASSVTEPVYNNPANATFVPASVSVEEASQKSYDPADYIPEGKSPVLTDSYVTRKINSNSQYYATGYTTVMDGTTPYYHYTTVTLEQGLFGPVLVSSGRVYGSGKVSATTPTTPTAGDPNVYYGW